MLSLRSNDTLQHDAGREENCQRNRHCKSSSAPQKFPCDYSRPDMRTKHKALVRITTTHFHMKVNCSLAILLNVMRFISISSVDRSYTRLFCWNSATKRNPSRFSLWYIQHLSIIKVNNIPKWIGPSRFVRRGVSRASKDAPDVGHKMILGTK